MKILAVMLFVSASASAQVGPLPETANTVEYRSVAEALSALHDKPGVQFFEQGGWTIAHESAPPVVWSFAPAGHAAYPTVVKRAVVESDGKVSIQMGVICQSTKSACDALVREFIQMNENMRLQFQSRDNKSN